MSLRQPRAWRWDSCDYDYDYDYELSLANREWINTLTHKHHSHEMNAYK